jgi:hypothetical protein
MQFAKAACSGVNSEVFIITDRHVSEGRKIKVTYVWGGYGDDAVL